MVQLLLIEDDLQIRTALVRGLSERNHVVSSAPTGFRGLQDAVDKRPDLVVLDLGLPDVDGQEVLKMIRAVTEVPVIVATARDDDSAVVQALNAGADDYLVKPFSVDQLDARVRAVLRRTGGESEPSNFVVGELDIDPRSRVARLGADELDLTAKEFDLLAYLAAHADEVISKRVLLAEVWHEPFGGSDKTVDVHLSWLRRKLGESAQEPHFLHTVRGVGVKLVEP